MQPLLPAFQLAFRASVGAGIAVIIARWLGLPGPAFAMIAAVIVTDLSPAETRRRAWQRIAGTILGAAVGAALSPVAGEGWTLVPGILAAMLACLLLGMTDAAKLAGYLCGVVLLEHSHEPWAYALVRLVETLLGIAVAVLVSMVPKLIREAPAPQAPAPPAS